MESDNKFVWRRKSPRILSSVQGGEEEKWESNFFFVAPCSPLAQDASSQQKLNPSPLQNSQVVVRLCKGKGEKRRGNKLALSGKGIFIPLEN